VDEVSGESRNAVELTSRDIWDKCIRRAATVSVPNPAPSNATRGHKTQLLEERVYARRSCHQLAALDDPPFGIHIRISERRSREPLLLSLTAAKGSTYVSLGHMYHSAKCV